jgi:hypothetical protein
MQEREAFLHRPEIAGGDPAPGTPAARVISAKTFLRIREFHLTAFGFPGILQRLWMV